VSLLFNKTHLNNDKSLLASYQVSLLVAKCGKLHTIGETLILLVVEAILKSMTNLKVTEITSEQDYFTGRTYFFKFFFFF